MADMTEAEIVRDLAHQAGTATVVERGKRYVWMDPDGVLVETDLSDDMPARKIGNVLVRDVASFAEYFGKHADDDSEVYANIDQATVTAVLDAHHGTGFDADADDEGPFGPARWQQHRLVLALQETLPWRTWTAMNGKPMVQQQFAEFLEDNRRDLDPHGKIKPADFLELAQSFHATTNLDFGSGTRLSSGEIELTYKETTQAAAGRAKKIEVPTEFAIAIVPFDDCQTALIGARFRYRTSPNGVVFMYVLDNPDRHREDAVKEIVTKLRGEIGDKPIMLGVPS